MYSWPLRIVRLLVDTILIGSFLLVWVDGWRVWFRGARGYIRWRKDLSAREGFPRWPSGRLTVQLEAIRHLVSTDPAVADRDQIDARSGFASLYLQVVIGLVILAAIVAADWSLKSLGG